MAGFLSPEKPSRGLVCPQGAVSLFAVEAIVRRRPIGYVTWVMDDHLVRWRDGSWRYPPQLEELFGRHLRQAKAVFVISPAMGEFFQDRFGVASEVLFSPADTDGEPLWEVQGHDTNVRLAYFGTIWPWQLDALGVLAKELGRANAHLDIYPGARGVPLSLRMTGVRVRERVDPREVATVMRRYDAVVLPAGFDPSVRHLTELNIATKMSECLASGTVTLLVAPPYAAMVRFLESSGAAIIIRDTRDSAVVDAIKRVRSQSERRAVLQAARALVQARLCTAAMRRVWLEKTADLN